MTERMNIDSNMHKLHETMTGQISLRFCKILESLQEIWARLFKSRSTLTYTVGLIVFHLL